MLQDSSYISVDRPDIVKEGAKSILSHKEGKEVLYKFLMQSNIPFSGSERLYLKTEHKLKTKNDEDVSNLGLPIKRIYKELTDNQKEKNFKALALGRFDKIVEEKSEYHYQLSNQNYYNVTCKLKDITANGKPIYIIMLEDSFLGLNSRNKNRLIYLKNQYNIIIFDSKDLKKVGVDISDKLWLNSLNKKTLKTWANLLFKRLAELGRIDSSYTLNDIYSAIDEKILNAKSTTSIVSKLKGENYNLRLSLYKEILSKFCTVKDSHSPIIQSLVLLKQESVKWVESVVNFTIDEIRKIDLRKNNFKSALSSSKTINLYNIRELTYYLSRRLSKRKALNVEVIDKNVLIITHTKTLESFVLWLLVGSKNKKYELPKETYKKILNTNPLVYILHLESTKTAKKYKDIEGYVININNNNGKQGYNLSHRILIYDNKGSYSLKLPFNKG